MATVTGLTAEKINELVAGRVSAAEVDVEETILALAAGDGAQGALSLGHAYRLDKLVVSGPCRLRLYASATQRTADADRARDVDPTGDHGCIAEFLMTADLLSLQLIPPPHGYTPDGYTYYSVVNDGVTGDFTFTLTEQVLEP